MKNLIKIVIISTMFTIIFWGMVGCSPTISQEEYDSVKNELNDTKLKAEELQSKLDQATTIEVQYDQLNFQYQELKKQYDEQNGEIQSIKSDFDELKINYDARTNEIQGMQAEYDELNQEFEELEKQYDIIIQGNAVFPEAEINQAIFKLINQERRNNGLAELLWGVNLYGWARENSLAMAETGDFKYSSWLSVQAVLITAGQATLDGLVNGVLEVWKQRKHEYSPKILNTSVKYGAIATYKSGGVYYITYVASTSP